MRKLQQNARSAGADSVSIVIPDGMIAKIVCAQSQFVTGATGLTSFCSFTFRGVEYFQIPFRLGGTSGTAIGLLNATPLPLHQASFTVATGVSVYEIGDSLFSLPNTWWPGGTLTILFGGDADYTQASLANSARAVYDLMKA